MESKSSSIGERKTDILLLLSLTTLCGCPGGSLAVKNLLGEDKEKPVQVIINENFGDSAIKGHSHKGKEVVAPRQESSPPPPPPPRKKHRKRRRIGIGL